MEPITPMAGRFAPPAPEGWKLSPQQSGRISPIPSFSMAHCVAETGAPAGKYSFKSMTGQGKIFWKSLSPGCQLLFSQRGREVDARDAHGHRGHGAQEFKTLQQGPRIEIAANFRIEEIDAGHCDLSTETRVHAAGSQALRGFAAYWRTIYPGRSLIRRERVARHPVARGGGHAFR